MKRRLPLILVFVFGLVFLVQAYSPGYYSKTLIIKTGEWLKVVGFFALFIGIMVYGLSNFSLRYKVGMLIWICFALITLLPTIAKAMDGKPEPAEAVAPPPAD